MIKGYRQQQSTGAVLAGTRHEYPLSDFRSAGTHQTAGVCQLDYKCVFVWVTAILKSFGCAVTACCYLIIKAILWLLYLTLHNRYYAHKQ